MVWKRTIMMMVHCALLVGFCLLSFTTGESTERGCDLATEQPCRSNASQCVPLTSVGDGYIDCPDGSDEGCPETWFVCVDRSACVNPQLLQDGVADCADESDESCEEWQHECLCGFPRCVDASLVGDGRLDCLEGSDELSIDKGSYICPSQFTKGQDLRRRRRQAIARLSIPVQGTFFTETSGGQHAHLQVSLVDDPTNPKPVDEVVTLTGTQGRFIKDGPTESTTYSVFTGSYVRDRRTYLFFFGNTALPGRPEAAVGGPVQATQNHAEVVVKKGGDQSRILVDMEKDLQVIMPSKTHSIDSTAAPDLLMGEGMVDGRLMGGVFIEGSEGFDMEGSQSQSGETSMLTITIGRPVAHTRTVQPVAVRDPEEVTVLSMADMHRRTNDFDNEIDVSLMRARKARVNDGEIIADLRPTRALEINLPTYTIGQQNEPLEQVVAISRNMGKSVGKSVGRSVSERHRETSQRDNSVADIRAKYNLESGGGDSDLPTVTYVGFAEFTTTIANTVVVFTPRTESPSKVLKPQVSRTKPAEPTSSTTTYSPTFPSSPAEPTALAPRLAPSRTNEAVATTETSTQTQPPRQTETQVPRQTQTETQAPRQTQPQAGTPPLKTTANAFVPQPAMETRMVTQTEGTSVRTAGQDEEASDAEGHMFSTISTQRFNTVDLYPTGLVSSIGGTIVRNSMTTLLTTYVYGTYIQGQYAQIVQSTSSIFYLVSRSASPAVQATPSLAQIAPTLSPDAPETTVDPYDLYEYEYDGFTTEDQPEVVEEAVDSTLGRSVDSNPGQQFIVDTKGSKDGAAAAGQVTPKPPEDLLDSMSVYTHYTTYFKDGKTTVSTRLETSTVFLPFLAAEGPATEASPTQTEPEPTSVAQPSPHLTTYTYYTTLFVDGSSQISSRTEVHTKQVGDSDSNLLPSFLTPTVSVTVTPTAITTPSPPPTLPPPTSPPPPPPPSPSPSPPPPPPPPSPPSTTPDALEDVEDTTTLDDLTVIEAVGLEDYDDYTTESLTEAFTESMSESMSSESPTDSSAQDVTEAPGLTLDSSLNPDDEVNAVFYPRTYYTTYTYFTTYYRSGTSSIVSSLETLTNVVTDPSEQEKHKTLTPVVPTYPMTFYTTFTYWTTFFKENSTISTSTEKTFSDIVTPTGQVAVPTTIQDVPVADASPTVADASPTVANTLVASTTPAVTTFYTTYTYYTSTYLGERTIVNSRLETVTNTISTGVPNTDLPAAADAVVEPIAFTNTAEEPITTETTAFGFTTTEKEPFGFITTEKEPFGFITTEKEPFGFITTEKEQFGFITTEKEPFGFTDTEKEPFGFTDTEKEPFGFTDTEKEPFGFTDTEKEPFGFTTTEKEPFGFTATEDEPFGFTTTDEPFGFTTTDEPFGFTTTDEPFGFTTTDEPFGFTTTDEPFGFTTTDEPFGFTTSESEPFGFAATSRPFDVTSTEDESALTIAEEPFGFTTTKEALEVERPSKTTRTKSTGLLSTIRGSTVVDGTTTIFSTNIIGTVVDGLYAQIQSTTSVVIRPSSDIAAAAPFFFLTSPTTESSPTLPFFFLPTTSEEISPSPATLEPVFPLATESDFDEAPVTRPVLTATPTLDSSFVDVTTDATPVETATEALPEEVTTEALEEKANLPTKTKTKPDFPSTNRNKFPPRGGGTRRRPDILAFLRRTSVRPRPATITRDGVTPTVTATPAAGSDEGETSATNRPFRFGFINTPSVRLTPTNSPGRFRFQSTGVAHLSGSSRSGIFSPKSIRHSTPGFRFGSSTLQKFTGKSSPGGFRFAGTRSSVFPGSTRSISPSSVFPTLATTVAPVSDLQPIQEESAPESSSVSKNSDAGFRAFSFRPRQQSESARTRSSVPFALLNRRPGSPVPREPSTASRFTPKGAPETPEPTLKEKKPAPKETTPAPRSGFRINRVNLEERRRNSFRQRRPDLSKLFRQRNTQKSDLENEATDIEPVFVEAGGRFLTPEELAQILADEIQPGEPLERTKRQTRGGGFGERSRRERGSRTSRSRDSLPLPPPKSSSTPRFLGRDTRARSRGVSRPTSTASRPSSRPGTSRPAAASPVREDRGSQFTLTNSRGRGRGTPPATPAKEEKPAPPPPSRSARRSTSRTSLPTRPRSSSRTRATVPLGNIRGRGFRRPSTDNNFRASSKFTPKRTSSSPIRRPPPASRNTRQRPSLPSRNTGKPNPIEEFRSRPSPPITTEPPPIFPSDDGGFLIQDELTVTREAPVKATIPLVEDGQTIQKEVITASLQTEIVQPDQITQTEIDGTIRLLLSSVDGANDITHYVVDPVETTFVTYTPTFIGGRRTSASVVLPSTAFNVVSITKSKPGGDLQQLLQLLITQQQQQQQNPLLAALGLGQPTTTEVVHTRSFVTTVTNVVSTALPIIFRGKTIQTTIVESEVEVVTATELSTETVITHATVGPLGNPNPLNQLLPLLLQGQLQQQSPQIRPTREPSIQASKVDPQLLEHLRKQQKRPSANQRRPRPEPAPTPSPVETSVVTLYVSGRRPGDFSTILSTVTISGDATRRKRGSLNTKEAAVQATALPHYIETDKGVFQLPDTYNEDDMDWFIMSAMNEVDTNDISKLTPGIDSVLGDLTAYFDQAPETLLNGTHTFTADPFLWEGPAELAPLKRNVRSAQRGTAGIPEGRKIQDGTAQQIVDHVKPQVPTTYYTTFTYYTTLVNDLGSQFVRSSEETVTHVTTPPGGSALDDPTKTSHGSVASTAVPIQAKFTLDDAIVPGKPRPVPDPIFPEPPPPFGPVIHHFVPEHPSRPVPELFTPEDPGERTETLSSLDGFVQPISDPDALQQGGPAGPRVPQPGRGHASPQLIIQSSPGETRRKTGTEAQQKPRRVVLARRRPVPQQVTGNRVRVVVTRRRPMDETRTALPFDEEPPLDAAAAPSVESEFRIDGLQEFGLRKTEKDPPAETAGATHEIVETEEQDTEEEVAGRPGAHQRVRVTLTNRRQVQLTEPIQDDKTTTLSGGRRRVVVTRHLPRPTVLASPVKPVLATVSTYYTVFSYLYTLYESASLYSVSTRELTVSNEVEPTVVSLLPTLQAGTTAGGFYTLQSGRGTSTLGERVIDSFTTQIFLASATLVNLTPEELQRGVEAVQRTTATPEKSDAHLSQRRPITTSLQSSLVEEGSVLPTDTPFLTTSSFRATQARGQTTAIRQRQREGSVPLALDEVTTATAERPQPSRAGVRNRGRGTVRFTDPRGRVRVTVTRRRPIAPATPDPAVALTTDAHDDFLSSEAPLRPQEHFPPEDAATEPGILEDDVSPESPVLQERPTKAPPSRFSRPGGSRRRPTSQSTRPSPEDRFEPRLPPSEDATPRRPSAEDAAPRQPSAEDAAPRRPSAEDASPRRPSAEDAAPRRPSAEDASTPRLPAGKDGPPLTEGTVLEEKEVTEAPQSTPKPTPTPTQPTRPPRKTLRRDDIPIIRRPGSDRGRPFVRQQGLDLVTPAAGKSHRFTPAPDPEVEVTEPRQRVTPASGPEGEVTEPPPPAGGEKEPDPVDEGNLYDEYYYDEEYYYYDEENPESSPADEALEEDTKPPEAVEEHSQPPAEGETATESSSPTVTRPKPKVVRPTPSEVTSSSFDITEARKRERTHTRLVTPTRTRTPSTRQRTRPPVEPPTATTTSSRASNEVYTTYATTTLLPILGGERSITLTILTSSLTTLPFDPATTEAATPSVSAPPPSLAPSSPPVVDGQLGSATHALPDEVEVTPTTTSPAARDTSTRTFFTEPETSRAFGIISSPEDGPGSGQGSGRAVVGRPGSNQVVGSLLESSLSEAGREQQRLGARFSIGARHNLATKVMSNGVEVIVAGDKTASPLPHEKIITNNFEKFQRPITLPPSTLSDQMLLFASLETDHPKVTQLAGGDDGIHQTNTYFTTYTFYNTLLAGNKPFVITSKQTVENVVTVPLPEVGNFIERTEVTFDTHTYYTTQTFSRTIGLDESQRIVTSEEVLTQVVITEAPSVQRSSVAPTLSSVVTKTYFTTLTYYNTAVEGATTIVTSDTVVSSEVVTETALVTTTPSLNVGGFSLTPVPALKPIASFDANKDDLVLYATKTVYTTLTYLTTILEGSETVTASRTEISSNVVTEPLTSAVSSEEFISLRSSYLANQVTPAAVGTSPPQTVAYMKLQDNVYKQLRTFFATYTRYTTLHNGAVQSRLETNTKILTLTLTTSSVPASLLIHPTTHFGHSSIGATTVSPSLGLGTPVQLDPSYLSSLKSSHLALKPTTSHARPGVEESLQATVLVEKGDASGTSVVSDSTTSATLLVRPPDELSTSILTGQTVVIFDPAHLSSLKASFLASLSSQLSSSDVTTVAGLSPTVDLGLTPTVKPAKSSIELATTELPISPTAISPSPTLAPSGSITSPRPPVSTPVIDSTTVVTGPDGPPPGPVVPAVGEGTTEAPLTVHPAVAPATFPIHAGGTAPAPSAATDSGSSGGISITGSSDSGLNIDLGPMLTAVAGLLRNNLNNQLISAKSDIDSNRRKTITPLRPPNTLISAQREPLLIPVGGVGASISSSRDHTEGPEHGFIPLRRPGSHSQGQPRFPAGGQTHHSAPAPNVNPGFIKIVPGRPRTEVPGHPIPLHVDEMEGFGPTFLPPHTQSGFTAITGDPLGPTRVSVISGSPTIFFGGVGPNDLPPPGQPAPSPIEGHNIDSEKVVIYPSRPAQLDETRPSRSFLPDQTRPVPVPVRVPLPGDGGHIPLPVTPDLSDQLAAEDTQPHVVLPRPQPHRPRPSRVGPQTIVSIEGDNRIVRTQVIHAHHPIEQNHPEPSIIVSPAHGEFVLQSTVGVGILSDTSNNERPPPPPVLDSTVVSGAETILLGQGLDSGRTTVVRGSSTVLSGATTIFGSLFTRPADNSEPKGDLTSVVSGPGGIPTHLITRMETSARTITATRTEVIFTAGITSTLTEVVHSTLPLRTIVTTIIGSATHVNYVTSTVTHDTTVSDAVPNGRDPTTYPPGSPFDPANYPSFPLDPRPLDEDLRLPGDAEVVLSEATLGIAENNEISRVVESKSPDQEINIGGPLSAPVSLCDPQCSAARHEVCKVVRGAHTCVCRAGYARKNKHDTCKQSLAFNIQLLLDRMSNEQLVFDSVLRNTSHPITQDLSDITVDGINQAMMASNLGPRFHSATITKFSNTKEIIMPASVKPVDHGLVADIKVELSQTEESNEFGDDLSESIIKEALQLSLKNTNYSLGSTEIFANREISVLAAKDFDECSYSDHNDCSIDANCFNTPGSYLCACRDGFKDMADLPGRECAVQTEQCARCNFQGECVTQPDGSVGCRCLQWFSGAQCQINLRVLLIVLVTVGSLLILLVFLCLALCCLRARRNTRSKLGQMPGAPTFLRGRASGMSGTLDRRAMIHETSSESSIEHSRLHASFMLPSTLEKQERLPRASRSDVSPCRAPRSDMSMGRNSHMSFAEDRSVGVHTTLPPVLIPRVKGPAPPRPSVVSRGEDGEPRVMIGADARSDLANSQQAFVDLLEQPGPGLGRSSRRESMIAPSVQSSTRINRSRSHSRDRLTDSFLHQLHPQGSTRSRSTDRLDHSNHDFNSDFGVNFSFRGDGERTMSVARSYDETTVRPPIKTMRTDSFYSSKALSSQHISDEHQMMAERDGGSTVVYPQTELYRPVRDTDSLSDMSEQHSKEASSRAASRNFFS
ncbi:LOW QUALITY PROTEIN: uncharacterized protein [Panulirus ornatus]|uniref:LOW QUALITY PROTEIN: uncharacterized protein n=1 Tax=Panulirus ornatus TaxID=150431 RepID=UPI003A8651A8